MATVYYYFRKWKYAGVIEVILEEVVFRIRESVVTDTLGNLLAVEVHSASYGDRAKAFDVISAAKKKYKNH